VVEKADEIKVKFSDEREMTAKVIGRDPKTDIALIKVDSDKSFTPLPMGDSDKLDVESGWLPLGIPLALATR